MRVLLKFMKNRIKKINIFGCKEFLRSMRLIICFFFLKLFFRNIHSNFHFHITKADRREKEMFALLFFHQLPTTAGAGLLKPAARTQSMLATVAGGART